MKNFVEKKLSCSLDMIAISLVFVSLAFLIKYFWDNRRFYFLLYKIPWCNFKCTLREFINYYYGDSKYFYSFEKNFLTCNETIAKFFGGSCWIVILQKLEDVKIVLNSKNCLDKGSIQKLFDLDMGSVFGSLDAWQRHHKLIKIFFNAKSVKKLAPIFEEKSLTLVEVIRKKVGDGAFDIFDDMAVLTLEMILNVMEFEVDLQNSNEGEKKTLIQTLKM